MHYLIEKRIIKSEYSAKSIKQPNKVVLKYIESLPENSTVLDYGCGKFRYTIPISKKVKSVVAIDSDYQLKRKQIINEEESSLVIYAKKHMKNVYVTDVKDEKWKKKYDYIFCTNVLTAIPDKRTRMEILQNLKTCINQKGQIYLCVQYRNSYFTQYKNKKNAIQHHDGWLIPSGENYTFYGIINPEDLYEMCYNAGIEIIDRQIKDGSCFVIAH